MFEWAYSGVNKSVPRNAGPECAEFLTPERRTVETVIMVGLVGVLVYWGLVNLSPPSARRPRSSGPADDSSAVGKRVLLTLMAFIWGMEIGYKFSSRTVIYLLNPCHVTTAIQIYLLAARPSTLVTAVFRIHLNFLNGPLLAFMFPETDSRVLPLEAAIYWIQHGMMFVVPYYLLQLGGVYNMEKMSDLSWNALSFGLNIAYHFFILQAFAIPSQVNLNHMLCPAVLDPFGGPSYRMWAIAHQSILCPALCKLYIAVSTILLTIFKPETRIKITMTQSQNVPTFKNIKPKILPDNSVITCDISSVTPESKAEKPNLVLDETDVMSEKTDQSEVAFSESVNGFNVTLNNSDVTHRKHAVISNDVETSLAEADSNCFNGTGDKEKKLSDISSNSSWETELSLDKNGHSHTD